MDECIYHHSKHRRVTRSSKCSCNQKPEEFLSYRRKIKIIQLPNEILEHIFKYLPSLYLVTNVQYVSERFASVCRSTWKMRFTNLPKRLCNAIQYNEDQLKIAKYNLTKRKLCKIIGCLEILTYQYKVIEATIWRYIKPQPFPNAFCKHGAKLLDLYDDILYKIYYKPREFKVLNTKNALMEKFKKLSKLFLSTFERRMEKKLNKNCRVSGAKMCDLLDCLIFAEREVLEDKFENEMCHIKIKYRISNTWFTAMALENAGDPGEPIWEDQQRLMYLRMRRIVLAHNLHAIGLKHWERETELLGGHVVPIPKPINSLYAGYGQFGNQLFYYGSLNQGAYECKLRKIYRRDNIPVENRTFEPQYLNINVTIQTPKECAPLFVCKERYLNYETKHFKIAKRRKSRRKNRRFYMRVEFDCELSATSDLPSKFVHEICEKP